MYKDLLSTYIIHYTKLKQRRLNLISSSIVERLNANFITEEDVSLFDKSRNLNYSHIPVTVKQELMAQVTVIAPFLYHHFSLLNKNSRAAIALYKPSIHETDKEILSFFYSQGLSSYSSKNLELTCQHLKGISNFINIGNNYCLILEDDVIPKSPEYFSHIEICLKDIRKIGDGFFDISDSLGLVSEDSLVQKGPIFSKMGDGQTRCSSAYIISKNCAKEIINSNCNPILPIDWHLSYVLNISNIPTYWLSPSIFSQGSQQGIYFSNQIARNKN